MEKSVLVSFDQVGESLLQEGKIRQALGEFIRLSSMHPGEALHYTQIARDLLAAGLGEAANPKLVSFWSSSLLASLLIWEIHRPMQLIRHNSTIFALHK